MSYILSSEKHLKSRVMTLWRCKINFTIDFYGEISS
jgi:hypothetical protein